ncbi:hypothetical protein QTP70_008836 [Hemibagrus guttatus]|uniref:Uncharacterized protein n=1 Tax=Hemibagrus guttatus TaxID=175788 RepID=A0AAE0QZ52_9TELE|nr:hypothetical protein QTP70_008836 [Hemibagrus guttatus]
MLYGLETVSLRKRQESELEVAELKMLRISLFQLGFCGHIQPNRIEIHQAVLVYILRMLPKSTVVGAKVEAMP